MPFERVYVGTHRRAHRADPTDVAFGIYMFARQHGAVPFKALGLTETPQPGWIAMHPGGRFLYVANEVRDFEGTDRGGVSAFAVEPETGTLLPLNTQLTSPLPCHCAVDGSGRYLLVATFGGGTVHLFPLEEDGSIGPQADVHQHAGSSIHPRRQTQPHAHGISIDPANRFVLVPDLGTDSVVVYELDHDAGKLMPHPDRNVQLAPGSGPRHIVFDPQAKFAYVMNEMSATISVLSYDASCGEGHEIQCVDLLPQGFGGLRSGAELALHPEGTFLYATTRSHGSSGEPPVRGLDTIVWFKIDETRGTLRLQGRVASGGEIPRSFAFDSRGDRMFVAHQCSGTIITFRIDPTSGEPIQTSDKLACPAAVCIQFSGCR